MTSTKNQRKRLTVLARTLPLLALVVAALAAGVYGFGPRPDSRATSYAGPLPNCATAKAHGLASARVGEPGYRPWLDADGDGISCEPYRGP